jgi:(1->4)-alpha-D-glucan 1-alpha-D-glucosylmutase
VRSDADRATPLSTYRLQLGPDLTFADAARLAPYLRDLGVSHAYLSPVLAAAPGSTHGYDVVDPTRVSDELGGPEALVSLVGALRKNGLGVVLDIVPNHVAVTAPESLNPALWAVLRDGAESPYARWFDIDWDAGRGRIVMPVLDGPLEANLDRLTVEASGREPVLRYFDHAFPLATGTATLPLAEALDAQHYRLADWRTAASDLNYRRFMDITTLIGVRVEDPEVFAATQEVVVGLVRDGSVDGLRIDHPDGLADPGQYLQRLADATGGAWVVVEKILAHDEPLPPDWPAAGTTGYETLTVLNNLLVDTAGEHALSRTYAETTGDAPDFATVARDGKRFVAENILGSEVRRLAALLDRTDVPDADHEHDVRAAIVALICELDVYRPFTSSAVTITALRRAAETAKTANPQGRALIDRIVDRVLEGGEFSTRFGQTAAAVYAKGVEDTAFYRFARLLSLNEVGGDPGRFGATTDEFHRHAQRLQDEQPTAMTTLSTHDTKRSEDVRARLAVLSELPDEWDAAVRDWLAAGEKLGCPDVRTGYFFWQTLVGAWPLDGERATRYMEKATREAKLETSWHDPDERYDAAVREFVAAAIGDEQLLAAVEAFERRIQPYARANSLAQKLLQLTMPGVPDVYQGFETARFTLVDPDNRGPVDFADRRRRLDELFDDKVRVTAVALRARRDHPDWFVDYTPLAAVGPARKHVVAFARSPHLVTIATRLSARLDVEGGWRDTTLSLPESAWVDALSGREFGGGECSVDDILHALPVAMLVPAVSVTP